MRDIDIRLELRRELHARFANDPDTRIIEELGICQGAVRIDLAVANCALHGFEIKSAADTLQRLPAQAEAYSRIFDRVTLVSADKHLDPVIPLVPSWWGIMRAVGVGENIALERLREEAPNPGVDPFSVAQLLWREEALEILHELGQAQGVKTKPRQFVWKRLVEVATPEELRDLVRARLKVREGWRAGAPRMSDDALYQPCATAPDSHNLPLFESSHISTDHPR